jgi:hypothetical protein
MNIHKMIAELQAEKERLDEAIAALERLSVGGKTTRRVKLPRAAHRESAEPETETSPPPKARSQTS